MRVPKICTAFSAKMLHIAPFLRGKCSSGVIVSKLTELVAPVCGNEGALSLHRALFQILFEPLFFSLVSDKNFELIPQETEVQILQS